VNDTIILGIIVLAPVIVLTVLRADAAMAFLSLCLGYVLVQFVSNDAISLLTTLYPHASSVSQSTIKIVFLFVPVALTLVATFHGVKGSRIVLNLLPAIGVGVLSVVLVEPLLSPGVRGSLAGSDLWRQFQNAQTLIVSLSALISLIFLWIQRRVGKSDKKHRSKG
jgi:hypothetical protein